MMLDHTVRTLATRPRVLLIGGPDVDARLPLMSLLHDQYEVAAAGSSAMLAPLFDRNGFDYFQYKLNRGSNPFHDLRTVSQLKRILQQYRPAVVHTFDTKPGVWGRIAARSVDVPVIVGTLPGLGSLYTYNGAKTVLLRTIYRQLQKKACRASAMTIFQNRDDQTQLIDEGVVRLSHSMVIPGSGIDVGAFSPDSVPSQSRAALRQELAIDKETRVVTMVSRLIRSKGVVDFALAAGSLKRTYPDVRFLLVGRLDSNSADAINDEERALIAQNVTHIGFRKDIATILAISDIVTLPSYYREGIPRVLLEAGAMARPIVTTDSPGCRETVIDGHNGFLVPPHDPEALSSALEELVSDQTLLEKCGKASRDFIISRFSLRRIADQTRSLYGELLQKA